MARQSAHQTKPNREKSPRRDPTASGQRDAAVNRIAAHNYFLLEKFEAGLALTGPLAGNAVAVTRAATEAPSVAPSTPPLPVLAYYYIWFDQSSWSRAKIDKCSEFLRMEISRGIFSLIPRLAIGS